MSACTASYRLFESFHVLPVGATANLPAAITDGSNRRALLRRGNEARLARSGHLPGGQAALALISRVAPSPQIFSIGFRPRRHRAFDLYGIHAAIAAGIIQYLGALPNLLERILTLLGGGEMADDAANKPPSNTKKREEFQRGSISEPEIRPLSPPWALCRRGGGRSRLAR